ncbi:MAG TPA: hypothetical protein VN948_08430 [Terriglobales bacterium]|nr:hypothetical protein [Terriglobales bacterium]
MDERDIRRAIDNIFESYQRGFRDFYNTVSNLGNLYNTVDVSHQAKFFDHLFLQLTQLLPQNPATKFPAGSPANPSTISVIMRATAEFGPADRFFPKLFAYLDANNPTVASNWEKEVFSEMITALYQHPDRLPQATVDELKANATLYSATNRRSLAGTEGSTSFASRAADLVRAIEDQEFTKFEAALKKSAAIAKPEAASSDAVERLEGDLANLGLPTKAAAAMTHAREYLGGTGPFDPKIAADLIRSSIDETHRDIVKELAQLTAKPFSGKDSDGRRREYMREVGFISVPEEKFFSAIYTLLSEEASHRLISPKETVLVLERTVAAYLLLMVRRLSEFTARKAS